jgi:DinB family protein
MYLDALEFLDEEREAWAPFEALATLSDAQLTVPVAAAHGWSGRQLMGHLLGWQDNAMMVAKELAVGETSATKVRSDEEWVARGGDVINAEMDAAWAALPIGELRDRFARVPGELRGYLTVVPESRWLKHPDNQAFFSDETTRHYEDHVGDLRAILAAAGSGER